MRICSVGDNVVDRYVDRGVMYPGGNAVNVAVHIRRCGVESAYVGAVGDDAAGRVVGSALADEGVDITRMRVLDGPNAYASVRLVDGDRVFGDADLGVSVFTLDEADLDYLAGFDLVHTGDCSRLEGQVGDIAAVAPVSFDFSDRPVEYVEPLLPYVTFATFSRSGLAEADVRDLIKWAHSYGPRVVAVTRGAAGAVVSDGESVATTVPARTKVLDTLGAGDAFIARACVELVGGATPTAIVSRATQYAALTCQSFGAFGYEAPDLEPERDATANSVATS